MSQLPENSHEKQQGPRSAQVDLHVFREPLPDPSFFDAETWDIELPVDHPIFDVEENQDK